MGKALSEIESECALPTSPVHYQGGGRENRFIKPRLRRRRRRRGFPPSFSGPLLIPPTCRAGEGERRKDRYIEPNHRQIGPKSDNILFLNVLEWWRKPILEKCFVPCQFLCFQTWARMEEGIPGNVSYKCDFPSHLLPPSEKEGLVFGPSSSFPLGAAESGDSRRKGEGRDSSDTQWWCIGGGRDMQKRETGFVRHKVDGGTFLHKTAYLFSQYSIKGKKRNIILFLANVVCFSLVARAMRWRICMHNQSGGRSRLTDVIS